MRQFYRFSRWLRLALVVVWPLPSPAAQPTSENTRAKLFQAETAVVPQDQDWRITKDRPGTLVAEWTRGKVGQTYVGSSRGLMTTVVLTVTFQPAGISRTTCVVKHVSYLDGFTPPGSSARAARMGPYTIDDPETDANYRRLLDKAERQMLKKHPEFAGR